MKIERVENILTGYWHFVRITTDDGIVGVGEAGIWPYPEASERIVDCWTPYLVGKDPLQIEYHWNYMYRSSHFMGAGVAAAMGAIDIALWDIAGKHFKAPVYELMGGRCRDRVRCYMHIKGDTVDALVSAAKAAVDHGLTAVRFDPLPPHPSTMRLGTLIRGAVERVGSVREAIGPDIDIAVEIHCRLSPMEVIELARALVQFQLFFMEDPILPESAQSMAEVQKAVPVPIATGERFFNLYQFRELLAAGGCRFVRPDVCVLGLTQAKKVAAIAESYYAGVIPHNPLSPVSTATCIQLAASTPNFTLLELFEEEETPKVDAVRMPLRVERGYITVHDRHGIGVELNDEAIKAPFVRRALSPLIREDASVMDR